MDRLIVISASIGFLFVSLAAVSVQINEIDSSVAPDVFDMITSFTNVSYMLLVPAIMVIGITAVLLGILFNMKEEIA